MIEYFFYELGIFFTAGNPVKIAVVVIVIIIMVLCTLANRRSNEN